MWSYHLLLNLLHSRPSSVPSGTSLGQSNGNGTFSKEMQHTSMTKAPRDNFGVTLKGTDGRLVTTCRRHRRLNLNQVHASQATCETLLEALGQSQEDSGTEI
jgi:hypothetical protein